MTFASESGMRLLVSLLCAVPMLASPPTFFVMGNKPGAWPEILSSIGLVKSTTADAAVIVVPQGAPVPLVERGIVVLEGESPSFGFRASTKPHVLVRGLEDVRSPKLRI